MTPETEDVWEAWQDDGCTVVRVSGFRGGRRYEYARRFYNCDIEAYRHPASFVGLLLRSMAKVWKDETAKAGKR